MNNGELFNEGRFVCSRHVAVGHITRPLVPGGAVVWAISCHWRIIMVNIAVPFERVLKCSYFDRSASGQSELMVEMAFRRVFQLRGFGEWEEHINM